MTNAHGSFIWYELITPDTRAAEDFYSGLLGWNFGGEPDYRHIVASEGMVGGLLALSPEMSSGGAHPAWLAYVAVDDVERSGRTITPTCWYVAEWFDRHPERAAMRAG